MADDRHSSQKPAPADSAAEPSDKRADEAGRESAARKPLVPEQPTRATPAPSSSRHDREVAAKTSKQPGRLARALTTGRSGLNAVRARLAAAIWTAAVLAAVALSLGALLVALGANRDNSLVNAVLDLDQAIDGPFWKVFDFYKETKSGAQGPPDDVKNHLVNWGLAAAGYLVVGRLLDRLIRPASR